MVIVAVAGDNAIGTVEDCAKAGVKIAVVMASGFGEVDPIEGKAKERAMVATAHKHGMRIVGPNSQGLANFGTGAIASFSTMFMDMERAKRQRRRSRRDAEPEWCAVDRSRWVFARARHRRSAHPCDWQ